MISQGLQILIRVVVSNERNNNPTIIETREKCGNEKLDIEKYVIYFFNEIEFVK